MDAIRFFIVVLIVALFFLGTKIPKLLKKKNSQEDNTTGHIKNSKEEINSYFDEQGFERGILQGKHKPSKIEKKFDKKSKPYLIFDFPEFKCQVHVHFNDELLEEISYAKIKLYGAKQEEEIYVNNQLVAMLRHYTREFKIKDTINN